MNGRLKMKKKLKMKIRMKKIGGTASSPTLSHEVYDTEAQCEKCGMRLYVSKDAATLVIASLRSTGVAGLVCLCGHTAFIDAELRPHVLLRQQRRRD